TGVEPVPLSVVTGSLVAHFADHSTGDRVDQQKPVVDVPVAVRRCGGDRRGYRRHRIRIGGGGVIDDDRRPPHDALAHHGSGGGAPRGPIVPKPLVTRLYG